MSKRTEKGIHRAWKSHGDWCLCTPAHGDVFLYREERRSRARSFELRSVVRTEPVMLFEALCMCIFDSLQWVTYLQGIISSPRGQPDPSHLPLSWAWGATGEASCASPFPEGCVQGWSLAGWKKKKKKNPAKKMNSLALSVAVECLTLAVGLWVLGLAAPGMGGMAGGWAQAVSPVYLYIPTSFSTSATAHPKALHWSVHTFIKISLCIFYTSFPPDLNVLMNIYYIQLNFSSVFGCREWNLYYYLHILLLFAYLYLHLWLYY